MSLERGRPRRPRRGGGWRSWESEEGGGTHRVERQDGHRSRAGAPGFSADIRRPMDDADSGCHANGRNRAPRVERNPCCPAKVTVAWGSKIWRASRPDSPQKTVLKIVKRVGPGGWRSAERQLPEVEGPAEPRRTAPFAFACQPEHLVYHHISLFLGGHLPQVQRQLEVVPPLAVHPLASAIVLHERGRDGRNRRTRRFSQCCL